MRKILTIPTLSASLLLQGNLACAESDVGAFQSTVTIQGNIGQSSSGASNRQDLNIGSASNSRTRSFNANVSTGAIHQSAQGSGIQQRINVGSMQNSQASTFSATVQTRSIEQIATKSGQRQELDIGSATNSTVNGMVNTSVNVGQDIRQIGSGEIVLGSVKNSTIGNFNQNLTVQGQLTGNNIRMGSVIGQEQYNNKRENIQITQVPHIENDWSLPPSAKQSYLFQENENNNSPRLRKLQRFNQRTTTQHHPEFKDNTKEVAFYSTTTNIDMALLENIDRKIKGITLVNIPQEIPIYELMRTLMTNTREDPSIYVIDYIKSTKPSQLFNIFLQIEEKTYFGNKRFNALENILIRHLQEANISLEEFKYFHYNRNELQPRNISYKDVINNNLFEKLSPEKSLYHQIGATNFENEKFISADGHFEYVFHKSNTQESASVEMRPISNPVNMGTYNIFQPKNIDAIGHMVFDVLPWILYGNSIKDTSTFEWRRALNNAATNKALSKTLGFSDFTLAAESEINFLRTDCKCNYK